MKKFIIYSILLCTISCKKKDTVLPPVAPSTLTATANSTSEITLAWTDNATNEQGFKVERRTGNGAYQEVATVNPDIISYKDAGLSKKTAYTYRIYAFNKGGKSTTYSNEATAFTFDEVPAAAANLVATAISSSQIELAWEDKSNNETGYKIERKLKDGTFSLLTTLGVNANVYSDKNLNSNTIYQYRVYPFNESGNAPYSNEAVDTTLPDLTNGLVAYYPFTGNAGDSSGNGNHGTVNGATLTTDRFGITNRAYYFNGSSSITAVSANKQFNKIDTALTICVWVKLNSFFNGIDNGYSPLISKDGPYWHQYEFFIGSNGMGFWGPNIYQGIAQPFALNNWYFAVVTFNKGIINYFLNGNLIGTNTDPVISLQPSSDSALEMGMDMANRVEYLIGCLDDIRIYNRVLNQAEIIYLTSH